MKALFLATSLALVGFSGAARSEVLIGGPIYGGSASVGGLAACRIFNGSNSAVSVSTRQLFSLSDSVAIAGDTCNVLLAANKSCFYFGVIAGNFQYSCRATVVGAENRISGTAEIQKGSAVLAVTPMIKY